jgi:hypothetical protein
MRRECRQWYQSSYIWEYILERKAFDFSTVLALLSFSFVFIDVTTIGSTVIAAWSNWGSWECHYEQSLCVMARYRTCLGNRANHQCPGQDYELRSCDNTCSGKMFNSTTNVIICLRYQKIRMLITRQYALDVECLTICCNNIPILLSPNFFFIYNQSNGRKSSYL